MEFDPKPEFVPDSCMLDEIQESLRPKKDKKEYFIQTKRNVIRNPEYRKCMVGRRTVYDYVWANIVRKPMYNDKYNIKRDYYDKGFLAYGSTFNHIAEACYLDKNTVIDYIEDFERQGVIRTEKLGPRPTKRDKLGRIIDRRKTVFILGTWHKEVVDGEETITERYYLEDVFNV